MTTEYAFEGPKRSSDAVTWSFAAQTYGADAAAPFSGPFAAAYQATIGAAFDRWSSVSGLTFSQIADSPGAAIRVGFGDFPSPYILGETIVRSAGGYLPNNTVIRLLDPSTGGIVANAQGAWIYSGLDVTLYQVALHEIGHALGLDHTTDPTTLMYPVVSGLNTDLATGDIEGINTLYPLYTVSALDPVQVEGNTGAAAYLFVITRHNDPASATTIDYQVTGTAYPGFAETQAADASEFAGGAYPSGQLIFAAGTTSLTLSIQVAGNTVPQPDLGFALSLSSTAATLTTTVRGTLNAAILDDDSQAAVNGSTLWIYRFFDTVDGTHFFTASTAERNAVVESRPDLRYEGPQLSAVADSAADPESVPVYRFFDTVHGTHFYTESASERDAVIGSRADLIFEGIGFYEHATAQSGDTAVYRYFDTLSGTHFLTSGAAERATILATRQDFINEGVAFYAPASA